jgi:hypothetical protein
MAERGRVLRRRMERGRGCEDEEGKEERMKRESVK